MKPYSFKKLFLCCLFFIIPLSLLGAFLTLFEIAPINFNGSPTTGIKGFIVCIAIIPFWALMFGFWIWVVINLGDWFYSLIFKEQAK